MGVDKSDERKMKEKVREQKNIMGTYFWSCDKFHKNYDLVSLRLFLGGE